MKILSNAVKDLQFVPIGNHWAEVVMRHSTSGAISGPFLACYEGENTPRIHSGPGPGACRSFLIDLHHGCRYNICDGDKFTLVKTELRIMESK